MAKIGLRNFYYSVATEDSTTGALSYNGATKPGKAISVNFEPNTSDATLYADDAIAERDTSVNGGTLTIGIDRFDATTASALLGHSVTTDIETSNTDDIAPKVGIAYIVPLLVNSERKYRVSFYPAVTFQEPTESADTKGETVEFGTYELEGTVMPDATGNYRKRQTFDSVAAADAWIATLLADATPESE